LATAKATKPLFLVAEFVLPSVTASVTIVSSAVSLLLLCWLQKPVLVQILLRLHLKLNTAASTASTSTSGTALSNLTLLIQQVLM
jgi:hypothetical protein